MAWRFKLADQGDGLHGVAGEEIGTFGYGSFVGEGSEFTALLAGAVQWASGSKVDERGYSPAFPEMADETDYIPGIRPPYGP